MKIAILFSGQYRSIPIDIFKKSLSTLVDGIDYSIFSYCWEEKGDSMNHSPIIPAIKKTNICSEIENIFSSFNLENYSYESFSQFKKTLEDKYKIILNSDKFHIGTIHSLPQIYTLFKCYELFNSYKNSKEYDLIFRCRYDSIFIHPLKLFPLKKILESNSLYNINFGRAYYPKRIYDIFFGGSRKSMSFLSSIWQELPFLIDHRFNNNLDKRDACRIFYLSPTLRNISTKSFDSRICDIYRNSDDCSYESYIISSHLVSFFKFNKYYLVLKYFFKHVQNRKISKYKIIFYILKSLFLSPLSYIKRFKFISINK